MNAREAGKKGGQSRSPAKLAAAARNGFQKMTPAPPAPIPTVPPVPVLIVDKEPIR